MDLLNINSKMLQSVLQVITWQLSYSLQQLKQIKTIQTAPLDSLKGDCDYF